jgi:acetyl esterase/lipase
MSEVAARPIDAVRTMLADLLGGPDATIEHRREQSKVFAANQPPLPAGLTVTADRIAGVAVERITPDTGAGDRLFLHLHGGGYVMGDPAGSRGFTLAFALAAGTPVLSVDYRLAPDHPFPAAVDDALAVYEAVLAAGQDPGKLIVGGESAGGGLALALLVAARDRGLPPPAGGVLMSPWLDLACAGASQQELHGRDPLLTRGVLLEMARDYLQGAEASHPWASPVHADLAGLPPLLVQVGSEEVLLDDSRQLAERAAQAGVEVTLEVCPDMIHVWQMFGAALPEASQAVERIRRFALEPRATC